ncbi:Solute carrier family 10 member 6 [Varanus komodoensis]|nr:Solute carrier family 10 member 6 [Varanus komodoensis]
MANNSDILSTWNETFGENEQRYGSKSYELAISVVVPVVTILVMLSIGCTLEMKKLCGHIKRPWGIAVGMMCQFGLMPLLACILLMNVSVGSIQALAIFFIGCCPGGATSNVISYWIDADMDLRLQKVSIKYTVLQMVCRRSMYFCSAEDNNWSAGGKDPLWEDVKPLQCDSSESQGAVLFRGLDGSSEVPLLVVTHPSFTYCSISVTVFSNVATLGTMPLFLFLFSSFWESEDNVEVPFKTIGTIFPGLLIPTACGIFVNYRWPKQSKIILKVGSIVGAILVPVLVILNVVMYEGSWDVGPSLLRVAAIFPLVGYLAGFLLARLTCQSWQRCRTISVGTGTQNMQLCVTALQMSFSAKHFGQVLPFLMIYAIFQLLYLLGIAAAYQTYKKLLRKPAAEERPTDPDRKTSDNLHGEVNLGFEKRQGADGEFQEGQEFQNGLAEHGSEYAMC